jgi:hypothetical protein
VRHALLASSCRLELLELLELPELPELIKRRVRQQ